MTTIPIKKYYPQAAQLKPLVKYFWVLDSARPLTLDHTILPVNNIDIIFNFLSPMAFEKKGTLHHTPGKSYFSGLTATPMVMKQQGPVQTIGVAFFPAGFFPFFKIPVSEFTDETIGLEALVKHVANHLESRLQTAKRIQHKIALLEEFFLQLLDPAALLPRETGSLLNHYYASRLRVREFCHAYGVHPRTLERVFNKYVGVSPKLFFRLRRFQRIVSRLMHPEPHSLTTVAHEFDYFDQTHFIKDFKAFSGSSPSRFVKDKRSIMQIMEIS